MVHVFSLTKVTSMNFLTLLLHIRTTLPTTYIYAGDFNAYTAKEIECHITPLDSHTLFHRTGDTSPAHSPASPLTTATAPAADYKTAGKWWKCDPISEHRLRSSRHGLTIKLVD